jgi:hypothetical protein
MTSSQRFYPLNRQLAITPSPFNEERQIMNDKPLPSIEDRQVFSNLASAVADVLDHPACPESLRDQLNEIASGLIDYLSDGNSAFELRGLARVHTEAGTPVVAIPRAKRLKTEIGGLHHQI